jgi:hypothetical protein
MAKVKLNIRTLSTTEKVAKARQIVTALTGNPSFTTPQPDLATLTAAADDLETAFGDVQTARQTGLTKTSILHEKEDALEGLLRQLATYVESIAGDDETKILSAGISIKTTAPSTPTAVTPIALSATEGDHDGELDLSWATVKGAKSYVVERKRRPTDGHVMGARSGLAQIFSDRQRISERYALLVPRSGSDQRRPERLERSGNQNRSLICC